MPLPTDHRPWPPPARRPDGSMVWQDLLFAHWPVPAAALRPLIPPALDVDTFDGQAWLGVVPFTMARVRPWWSPSLPWLSSFPELNVRTYVTRGGKPGVWFFSLDAGNPVAVRIARRFFHLPYFDAKFSIERRDGGLAYDCRRTHRRAPPAALTCRYRPTGLVYPAQLGDLDHWLTERYCFYAADRRGRLHRTDVHHEPWPLRPAEAEIEVDTMTGWLGIDRPEKPALLHFARRLEVVGWKPERVSRQE